MQSTNSMEHKPSNILALIARSEFAQTRCWVYGSSLEINPEDNRIIEIMSGFLSRWRADGLPISGQWQILHKRFIVIIKEPDNTPISGCGMDSMVKDIRNVEKALGTELLDSSRIFYHMESGAVACVNRVEFKELVRSGSITLETLVYNPIIEQLYQLIDGAFEKPLKDSWHKQLFDRALL